MGERDLYRDTWVRYLGYANEVGESFRDQIGHKNVMLTYGISTGYCIADTIDKTMKCYKNHGTSSNRTSKTIYTSVDTMTWQLLASVVIPGFTINRICYFMKKLLKKTSIPKSNRRVMVTATGLAMIPVIIHPIDRFVDWLLDNTVRKLAP